MSRGGFHGMVGQQILAPCVVIVEVNNLQGGFTGIFVALWVSWSSPNISSCSGIHEPSMFVTQCYT